MILYTIQRLLYYIRYPSVSLFIKDIGGKIFSQHLGELENYEEKNSDEN